MYDYLVSLEINPYRDDCLGVLTVRHLPLNSPSSIDVRERYHFCCEKDGLFGERVLSLKHIAHMIVGKTFQIFPC